jgi:hypothetical protein
MLPAGQVGSSAPAVRSRSSLSGIGILVFEYVDAGQVFGGGDEVGQVAGPRRGEVRWCTIGSEEATTYGTREMCMLIAVESKSRD